VRGCVVAVVRCSITTQSCDVTLTHTDGETHTHASSLDGMATATAVTTSARRALLLATLAGIAFGASLAAIVFSGTLIVARQAQTPQPQLQQQQQEPPQRRKLSRPSCEAWGPVAFYRPPPALPRPPPQCERFVYVPLSAPPPPPLERVIAGWLTASVAAFQLDAALAAPWHAAVLAAADPLKLYSGVPDIDSLLLERGFALYNVPLAGANLSALRAMCGTVFAIRNADSSSGIDPTLARWALADKLEQQRASARLLFRGEEKRFVVAVHVASSASTEGNSRWARAVVPALLHIAAADIESGGAVPLAVYSFNESLRLGSETQLLLHLASADALVCVGADMLCQQAAWATTRSFAIVQQPPATHCPPGVECVVSSATTLGRDTTLRFLDALDRWRVRRWLHCPAVWR